MQRPIIHPLLSASGARRLGAAAEECFAERDGARVYAADRAAERDGPEVLLGHACVTSNALISRLNDALAARLFESVGTH